MAPELDESGRLKIRIVQSAICANQTRRHAQPVIRVRAGKREQRFHGVKPAHPLARLAAGGKLADVIVRVILAAEKIAVQRQDDLRLVEMENRLHRLAERLRRRALMDAGINRVVGEPLRFRKFVGDDFLQPRA